MKKSLFIVLFSLIQFAYCQDRGTVKGLVTDKEMGSEALPFANVLVKGTSIGSTTDMDGNYTIAAPVGQQTIVFSFIGYETIEKTINVIADKTIVVNQEMGASQGEQLEEIEIKATVNKEKESALLLEQKKATIIKESIGAQRLAKVGVSDASGATTKISGVNKSEGTGDIYIRGLGDRYLSSTMNGLPIPSDDIEKKNIDLSLFSTNIIKNVGISKTYATSSYSDQGSGNVDIVTKDYSKKGFSVSLSGGGNTNVLNYDGDFRKTVISNDVSAGFYSNPYYLENLITAQGWDTESSSSLPINFSGAITAAYKFGKFSFFAMASHSQSQEYWDGEYYYYRNNSINNTFPFFEKFQTKTNSTAYANLKFKANDQNEFKLNILGVNKSKDELYESGRDGLGEVFETQPYDEQGVFFRDQNFKQTTMVVTQLLGKHKWNENNVLNWAGGINYVLAEEPNRIRNVVNILDLVEDVTDAEEGEIEFGANGNFDQRKSYQSIEDFEYNALINNKWTIDITNTEDEKPFVLNYGLNFRYKERDFQNLFVGVDLGGLRAPSIDELSSVFNDDFDNDLIQDQYETDLYQGELLVLAAFTNFDFEVNDKFSGNLGLRFEYDQIDMIWDVTNYLDIQTGNTRIGSETKKYQFLYPSINLKYELTDNQFLRFASSVTQTLPEFKEITPFRYVSPTGRIISGTPEIEKSTIYNLDLKWEMFPNSGELLSLTSFFKQIDNPINKAQSRGSAGEFELNNTGNTARVFGLEAEGRFGLVKNEDEKDILNLSANLTKMWFKQDLFSDFQYKDVTETGLQGASDLIANAALSYNSNTEHEFIATLSGNYSSDKIYALGGQESFNSRATLYNDEIIEKGFITLDAIISKEIIKNLSVKLTGRNLTNPTISRTQLIKNPNTTDPETNETVLAYKKGAQFSLGLKYKF